MFNTHHLMTSTLEKIQKWNFKFVDEWALSALLAPRVEVLRVLELVRKFTHG